MHVLVCVYDCLCFCIYVCIYECICAYMDDFISLKTMPFVFLNYLNENFQQCTKMNVKKCTLLLPPFSNQFEKIFTLLYLQCLFDLLVNVLHD